MKSEAEIILTIFLAKSQIWALYTYVLYVFYINFALIY